MKKKLEADLISLAHKILQLKNKEDVVVLQQEALKLYEKLSVLRFVEEHFGANEPTIGREAVEEKLDSYEPAQVVASEETKSDPKEPEEAKSEEITGTAAPADVASVIEQLAASKSVADDEPETSTETVEAVAEVSEKAKVPSDDASDGEPSENTETEDKTEPETEKVPEPEDEKTEEAASPTFDAALELEQPEAQKEAETAVEASEEPIASNDFKPAFELDFEAKPASENKYDEPAPSFTFDDLLGKDYADPVFVTQDELDKENSSKAEPGEKTEPRWPESASAAPVKEETPTPVDDIWSRRPFETKPEFEKPIGSATLNEKLSKGITIGLNDRIAFMKNLFNNSSEDYNRVLSQLMTIDNYSEARRFILEMVKPDYNDWAGKEEFEERFMEIVEKRFL